MKFWKNWQIHSLISHVVFNWTADCVMRQRSVTMLQRLNYFFYQGIIFWIFIKSDVGSERRLSECSPGGVAACLTVDIIWHTSSLSHHFHQILWKKEDGNNKQFWSPLNAIPEPLPGDLPQRHRTESSYETNRMPIEEKNCLLSGK